MLTPEEFREGDVIKIRAISKYPDTEGVRSAYTSNDYEGSFEEDFLWTVKFTILEIREVSKDQDLCRTDGKLIIGVSETVTEDVQPITVWACLTDKFELIGANRAESTEVAD